MPDNENLGSQETLFRTFSHFSLNEKNKEKAFEKRQRGKYKGGIPLAYDGERNQIAIDSSDTHTLIWGSTGSLKTRCVIEPTVKILGKSGESMIINDPKGEIYNRCGAELKENGYNVVVVNIRDPQYGNSWNPLIIPFHFYMSGNLDKATEFANDVAHNLMMTDLSTDDPFWQNSASDCMYGLLLLLFRYVKDHGLDESTVNMGNLMKLRYQLFKSTVGEYRPQVVPLWKYASEEELVEQGLSGTVYAPKDTRNSILSVFDQKMRCFTISPSLLDMLANNDFDMASIGEKATAVFLITPDEKTTFNSLVSLFVKQVYEYLIYNASNNEDKKLKNRVNFILDEFASLPPIADMCTMISVSRSRDIRFVLAVQGKHQLIKKYGDEADTIKGNCLNWIYLTSRELDLLKEISDLCGEKRNQTPNLSVYELQHFSKEKCEALVLCDRMKPVKVNLLDIDRFGEREYTVLDIEKMPRKERESLDFALSEEIRNRIAPVMNNGAPSMNQGIPTVSQRPMTTAPSGESSVNQLPSRQTNGERKQDKPEEPLSFRTTYRNGTYGIERRDKSVEKMSDDDLLPLPPLPPLEEEDTNLPEGSKLKKDSRGKTSGKKMGLNDIDKMLDDVDDLIADLTKKKNQKQTDTEDDESSDSGKGDSN